MSAAAGEPARAAWAHWAGWERLAKWLGLLVLGLIYLPLLWLALMSVSIDPLSGIPFPFSGEHYRALFTNPQWLAPLGASLLMGLVVGVLTAAAATVVGRVLPRARRSGALVLLAILPLFIPGMSMGAAMFIVLRSMFGLELGFWSMFLGHAAWAFPFALLSVLVLTTRFDRRLLEAAEDLGASAWRSFWDIEFPILRPAIIGAAIFGFLISLNEAQRSLFLHGQDTTLPIWNWIMASSEQSQVPIIFCLETLILAVVLPLLAGSFWFLFARLDRQ